MLGLGLEIMERVESIGENDIMHERTLYNSSKAKQANSSILKDLTLHPLVVPSSHPLVLLVPVAHGRCQWLPQNIQAFRHCFL